MGIKKFRNAILKIRANSSYIKALEDKIEDSVILLESGQGRGDEADVFALFGWEKVREAMESNARLNLSVAPKSRKKIAKAIKESEYAGKVKLITRNELEHRQLLAKAGTIITDDALPEYYIKKSGQKLYVLADRLLANRRGRSNLDKAGSLGLIQKTLLDADLIQSAGPDFDIKELRSEYFLGDGSINRLNYIGDISKEPNRYLAMNINEGAIAFENEIKTTTIDFLRELPEDRAAIQILAGGGLSFRDFLAKYMHKKYGMMAGAADDFYKREQRRLFAGIGMDEIHFYSTELFERIRIILKSPEKKVAHRIPITFYRRLAINLLERPSAIGDAFKGFDETVEYDPCYGEELWNDNICYGAFARFRNFKLDFSNEINLSAKLILRTDQQDAKLLPEFEIGSAVYEKRFPYKAEISRLQEKTIPGGIQEITCDYKVTIPKKDVGGWFIKNLPLVKVKAGGASLCIPIVSEKSGKVYNVSGTSYAWENRVELPNVRYVIKSQMVSDRPVERIKLALAFALSKVTVWNKPVLIFEKNCRNYEESGSILFERLVDKGYKNARFVLNKDSIAWDTVGDKYRKQVVPQYSFAHYYNMFAAKSIFSSEAIGHALEKGSGSSLFRNFVAEGSKNYVFLQHGVMYMVALSSEQRSFFRKANSKGKQRVVVSSQLESDHFTDNTNYEPEDVYVCGLLKFDKSVQNEDADKILVMLTWRPWEFVTGMSGMKETGYYKMLQRIIASVPENLRDKLIVMPHPLVVDQVDMDPEDEVWRYYVSGRKYDDLLKETKLLITDYSSISYDAFYRGCNVIFNWEEKDQCMKEYGKNGHLMLTEELAFGDVCYDKEALDKAVISAYESGQSERHLSNFSKLVEFHDGKNSDRFIKMAKKDGLL